VTVPDAAPFPPRRSSPPRRPSPHRPRPLYGAFLQRPATLPARAALVTVTLAAVTFFLLSYSRRGVSFGPYHIDLDVYRIGGRAWLRGGSLYGRLPATLAGARLPFTYPPAAAALLSLLSLLPMTAAATTLTLGSIALLAVVLLMFLRRAAGPAAGSPWALAWLLPPVLFLEPVRDTLGFGQVNVVLMALISLDCLAEAPRWPRGALTGLAAAIKLTPAMYVLFFLVRRDRRAACTTAVSLAAATALGFAADGHDSVRYWTSTVLQPGRAGSLKFASNQSILAVLARAGLDPHAPAGIVTWLALSAAAAAVACRGMRHALAAGDDCLALTLNALAALLISPVSWSHHWVWCVPALVTLTALGIRHRARLPLAAAAAALAVFAAAPQFWLPHARNTELRWALWQQAASSSYALLAALILLLASSAAISPPGGSLSTAAGPQQPGEPMPGSGQDTLTSARASPIGPPTGPDMARLAETQSRPGPSTPQRSFGPAHSLPSRTTIARAERSLFVSRAFPVFLRSWCRTGARVCPGVVGWCRARQWLGRRAGFRGVSRPRWRQSRSPVALPCPLSWQMWRPGGRRPAGGRRWRR
jgi:alpha-1,2-mannosyltransferase